MAITKAVRKDILQLGLYDFVAQNGHALEREDLINIIKGFNYAVYSIDKDVEKEATAAMLAEFEETEEEEEGEDI